MRERVDAVVVAVRHAVARDHRRELRGQRPRKSRSTFIPVSDEHGAGRFAL
ncbi:hypothetical protein [Microbacterium pumilum]